MNDEQKLGIISLRDDAKRCKKNIKNFDIEIKKQEKTITEYNVFLSDKNCTFDTKGLQDGITQANQFIENIKQSILTERQKMATFREHIDLIELKEKQITELKSRIEIDVGE